MTVWALLKAALIVAIAAYALVVGAMYFAQRSLLFPGTALAALPNTAPWGARVEIETPDGERLAALHMEAVAGQPTILLFGGNGDSIVNYGFLATSLAPHGYGLLALSYRGYPGSSGAPSETGLLMDGVAALDWLAVRTKDPVILLGRSLGSGVAVNTAVERTAAAIVLVSPYLSVMAVASSRYPYLPVSLLMRDRFRSDLLMGKVGVPKLFLHGDNDQAVPLASGQALFELAAEPKRFSLQKGHDHQDIWSSAAIAEIVAFIDASVSGYPVD